LLVFKAWYFIPIEPNSKVIKIMYALCLLILCWSCDWTK
jgi:hypothetical protein